MPRCMGYMHMSWGYFNSSFYRMGGGGGCCFFLLFIYIYHTHCSKGQQGDKIELLMMAWEQNLLNLFIPCSFSSRELITSYASVVLSHNLSICIVGFRTGASRKDKGNEETGRSAEEKPLSAHEMATTIQLQWLQVSKSIIQPMLGSPRPAPHSLDYKSQTGLEYLCPIFIDRSIHLAQPTTTSKVFKSF